MTADERVEALTSAELGDLAAAYGWWKAHGDPEAFYDTLTTAANRIAAGVVAQPATVGFEVVHVPPDCWPTCEYGASCPHPWTTSSETTPAPARDGLAEAVRGLADEWRSKGRDQDSFYVKRAAELSQLLRIHTNGATS